MEHAVICTIAHVLIMLYIASCVSTFISYMFLTNDSLDYFITEENIELDSTNITSVLNLQDNEPHCSITCDINPDPNPQQITAIIDQDNEPQCDLWMHRSCVKKFIIENNEFYYENCK